LVELGIQQICTLEETNAFLPTFIEKFTVTSKDFHNAHRTVLLEDNLDGVFTVKEDRALSKNLIFQYKSTLYQVETDRKTYAMRQAKIVVCEHQNGEIKAFHKGKKFPLRKHLSQQKQKDVLDSNQVNKVINNFSKRKISRKTYKSSKRHPSKRWTRKASELVEV
jgi:hypothetical protein